MKTSFKAVRAALVAVFVFLVGFAAEAQRVRLLQLERYLGQPVPARAGYVGLTDTLGDQYYHKLDSIIGYIADSIAEATDTDEQYFDTAQIVNDTLILSIIRDGLPAHRISLSSYVNVNQTLSYNHSTNELSISGGNTVTNFEQAWLRSPDQLHPISHGESVFRVGPVQLGYSGTPAWDEAQLRVYNESRLDWLTYTTSKPIFGQRFFEASELSNMLYLANKRYVASYNGTPTTDSRLFNGEFETPLQLGASSTVEVNVDFTEGLEKLTATGITYPQGYIYINFYYVYNDYDSIKVEVVTTTTTLDISSTVKNISYAPQLGYKVLRYSVPVTNYVTDLKVTFYTNTGNCWPTEIQYTQTRFAAELEEPFLNKHLDNKLHTKLTFRDKVGDRQNDNGTWGQIMMSKVDSVEWADFTAIPDLYTYITNISDSVSSIDDLDTDEQYFDSIAIVDDTLNVSIIRDGVPLIRIDLKPYLDDTDTDDQYFDVINITDDTLNLSIFDDGLPTHRLDLKPYLDTEENTDIQYIDTLYFDMDTLYISLVRDGVGLQKVYLGDLISIADSDKQRHDTAFIQDNIIYLSLQRDSIPAHQLDLTPYLDDTDDQTVDQFDIVSNILSISLEDDGEAAHTVDLSPYLDNTDDQKIDVFTFVGTTLSVSNESDGEASKTVDLSSLVDNWFLNGLDDVFGSTDIGDAETVTIDGTGGITAKLSFDGSNTMVIDGSGLQWILQAQSGTSQVIGDAASEIVEIVGSGTISTSISGNTVTISAAPNIDHDWYEVGTTTPPDAITDEMFHTGKTGIGMNPVWLLDVADDARINGHQIGTGPTIGLHTNIRFGKDALEVNTGSYNLAVGGSALKGNTSGTNNVAIGYESLKSNNSSFNIGIGVESLYSNITGPLMIGIGYQALRQNTTGLDNTAIGHGSQQNGIDASYNTSLGHETMYQNIHGIENTAIGDYALRDDTFARKNIAIGRFSLNLTDNANSNIGIGYYALHYSSGANYNIAIGDSVMHNSVTTGGLTDNIAIGKKALNGVVANSSENIAIGELAGEDLNGNYNIVIGAHNTSTADSNVIIGYNQSLSTSGNLLLTNGTGSQFIRMLNTGFVGLGVATPTQKLHVAGSARITGAIYDSNNDPGTLNQKMISTVTGIDWVDDVAASGTNLAITNSANPGLTSSTGSDIIFQDGTGIDAVYVNDFTVRFDQAAATYTDELQDVSFSYGSGYSNITLSGSVSAVTIDAGTGISFSAQSGTNMTIDAADAAANNEGYNGVGAGGATSATITTNTSGGNAITLNVAGSLSISEVANANGGTITLTGTGGIGTVTSIGIAVPTGLGVTPSTITTSGTFTFSLNNDLQALENLAGTGIGYRTGAATWTTYDFNSLPTGFSSGNLVYIGSDGTTEAESALTYNTTTNTLTVSTLQPLGIIQAPSPGTYAFNGTTTLQGTANINGTSINMPSIPTYADDAAAGAGGLSSGRLYKTGAGDLRIKL